MVLMMTNYGMLDHLEGSHTQWRYKGMGGELETKQFNYPEIFGKCFNYRHQVDNNINCRDYPISVDRTWDTEYWPGWCHAYFLALSEVNAYFLRG